MRFVILEHHDRVFGTHIDFMVEQPGSEHLRTWRMAKAPNGTAQPAEEIAPHRHAYLTYQGPVYPDRGWVRRIDAGTFDTIVNRPGLLRLRWRGTKDAGILELEGDSVDESALWQCRQTIRWSKTLPDPSYSSLVDR
ncbi:hypothetical protein K2X85_20135 [bacterium]|nr:hypothetical protein [bacterium]